jgi:hypothetical protein
MRIPFIGSKNNLQISFEEEALSKSVKPKTINPVLEGNVEKSKIVFDLESLRASVDNIYNKSGRITDKELRNVASYDSIISLIISTRANQVMSFGKRSKSKYNRGFLLRESVPVQDDESIPAEMKAIECKYRAALADTISKWIRNCGTSSKEIREYVFQGSDSFFKECSLSDYLSAQARNILTFGRYATQIIRSKDGTPLMWRPIPVETLYRVIDGRHVTMTGADKDVDETGAEDAKEWNMMEKERQPVAYVQKINGKTVSFFTEDEIVVGYYQKQAFENLNGYPLSPIEMAYYSVLMNFYSQSYMQNFMTKGLGTKGLINLKTTEGDYLSKEDIESFRKLFSNYVARNDNSATIPVVAGAVDVEWIPLTASPKDVEFTKMFDRIFLIVCSSFQISPHEIGFGALDPEGASAGNMGMKQDQIVQGEERGLRQLIEQLLDHVYHMVEMAFPQARELFILEAVGLGQNTKEADLALYKEELQTSGTFAKIWSDSERTDAFPYGGHVPSSPVFHQNVAKYMKYSQFMYHFFQDKEALNNPAYDFIIDPNLNEAYQSLKAQRPEIEQQNALLDIEQKKKQMQMEEAQMGMQMQQAQAEANQPQEAEADPSAELEKQKHEQKMTHEQQKHEQKMAHQNDQHNLSLRIAFAEMQRKMQESKVARMSNVIQAAKIDHPAPPTKR